jgi:hypothetical protein
MSWQQQITSNSSRQISIRPFDNGNIISPRKVDWKIEKEAGNAWKTPEQE